MVEKKCAQARLADVRVGEEAGKRSKDALTAASRGEQPSKVRDAGAEVDDPRLEGLHRAGEGLQLPMYCEVGLLARTTVERPPTVLPGLAALTSLRGV